MHMACSPSHKATKKLAWPPLVAVLLAAIVILAACGGEASPTSSTAPQRPIPTLIPATAAPTSKPTATFTPIAATPTPQPTAIALSYEELLSLFDYERQAALDIREVSVQEQYCVIVHDISYASPKGGRVPAFLVVPDGPGPFAGVILLHGLPGGRGDLLGYARDLAKTGVVALLIDAPFARRMQADPTEEPVTFTEQDRDEQVQLVVDLRRGVDLLTSLRDVDPDRIAYVGSSYGAAMGGLLAGIEDRIKAYALTMGIGGLVARARTIDDPSGPLQRLPEEQRERWLAAMEPIEPINHIGNAAPAALLFQSGRRDLRIPQEAAIQFQQAGSEPKEIKWYDSGHNPPIEALLDQVNWLETLIGIDGEKFSGPGSPAEVAEAFGELSASIQASDDPALQAKWMAFLDSALATAARPLRELVNDAAIVPIFSGNTQVAEKLQEFMAAPREERGPPFLELGAMIQASGDTALKELYGKIFISMLLRGEPSEALAAEFFALVEGPGNEEVRDALHQTGLAKPPCL